MKIFESYCKNDKKTGCVLAFGNFDGVHSGHRLLLAAAKEYAQKNSLLFGVYTFADSPKFANAHHSVLTTLETRLSLLESAVSPDFVYLEKFDDVKSLRPDEFADYIIEKFGCECTFCGENFRFGKNAEGNSQVLSQLMTEHGKNSVTVASKLADGMVVSSTRILGLLRDGKVSEAHELLGKPFGFTSEVIHGAHLGNKLGFPTVNQIIPAELVYPKYGVYSTIAVVDGKEYMSVTNFGIKPTVSDDGTPVAETYIIDFDGDVYGKSLSLYFVERLRDEKKFSSLEELRANISENVEQTRILFREKYEKN